MPAPLPDGTQINGTVSGKLSNAGTMIVLDGTNGTAIPLAAVSNIAASFYVNTGTPPQDGDWVITPTMGGQRFTTGTATRWRMALPDGSSQVISDDASVPAPRTLVARSGQLFKG